MICPTTSRLPNPSARARARPTEASTMAMTMLSRSVLISSWPMATEILMTITSAWAIRPRLLPYSSPTPSAAPRTRRPASCASNTPASSTNAAPNTLGRYSANRSSVADTRCRPSDSAAETRNTSSTNQ
ncbi:hypothetical protein D3C81_1723140 [compost metagenome]